MVIYPSADRVIRFGNFDVVEESSESSDSPTGSLVDYMTLTDEEVQDGNCHLLLQCQSGSVKVRWDGEPVGESGIELSGDTLDTIVLTAGQVRRCYLAGDGSVAVVLSRLTD